ncbi:DUF262 domain-containing protein [Flavobacterium caeni]|uniref:Uncharacterized conserved protein, contains ParB-like and HNH nuclease domains n=1 Tax=Flavobacterium caeni TaxID=490189 RepID=A0A1G5B2S3_9FLAO|nr:DUF262 domain-containing protein [Flavobacterium caeni]SCX84392.1 Uncharacterized conserved protein, contains ParB-like and HNH nuclease domains [Flavobacterium caeni]
MENILELKTINELSELSFYIPSYQRGYKWTDKEVRELLDDINEFVPKQIGDSDEKSWYCLQPIVVKSRSDDELEVIDGQQRLTTIYLILHYLNQDFKEERRDKLFHLDYETRNDTKVFLENLGDNPEFNDENIDFYYISKAYKTIEKWFGNQGSNFDNSNFRSKFKFNSKVIWYQSNEDNPIAVFTRINIGKIPLTNAELIKALFLNSSNFDKKDFEKLKLRQLEIATEWDQIESKFQNNKFWYFLTGNKVATNRIEFIFDLMNEEIDESDDYSAFRFFSKKFKSKTQIAVEKNWKEVKDYFQRFNEWYHERELYHKIGYLIYSGAVTIKQLYESSASMTKKDFRTYLDLTIRESLVGVELENLQYGDNEVKNILLLYNILTMLSSQKDNSYFPFDIFKNGSWDIEHITSVKDTMPDKNRRDWLNDASIFIDESKKEGKDLLKKIPNCDVNNNDDFKSLFEDIVSHFNSDIKDEDINDLSNLTLLDSETNRGYKNAVFPLKRKTIINRDKEGVFIPICTKNVFLKYFSEYPPRISFWTQDDRENYEKDLYNVLQNYLEV